MVLYSECTYGFQFSEEKKRLEIRFLVPEISNKYKRSVFFGRSVLYEGGVISRMYHLSFKVV